MKCKHCGAKIANDSIYCEYCGDKVYEKKYSWRFFFLIVIITGGIIGLLYVMVDNFRSSNNYGEQHVDMENVNQDTVNRLLNGKYEYIQYERGYYYVIAGSFPAESVEKQYIRLKKLDEYSPKILLQDGVKNMRICIGVFDNEDEAECFAKRASSSYWVLK